jgi:ABC-type polysaccharide/polyol phosphate export permease
MNLLRYRDAALSLALLNLRLRYNNTLIGAAWSLVNPLFFTLIFTFVFTVLLPNETPDFPVFVLSALLAWNYFQAAVLNAAGSVTNGRGLVLKIAFPRAVLPAAAILTELVTFSLALGVVVALLYLSGRGLGAGLLALPLLIALLTCLASGLGMLFAALNVYLRDTQEFLGVFMFGWFFVTPIIYSLEAIPPERMVLGVSARTLIQIVNPLSPLISAFRQAIYERRLPDLELLGAAALAALFFWLLGALIFGRASRHFAEAL